jgi:hypothetical protein
MVFVLVTNVGDSGKARAQAFAHGVVAHVAAAPRLAAARHFQHAVGGEEAHDAVEVVPVKGVEDRL